MYDIRVGDCRVSLGELPDNHIHVVVTSPPYFQLRDYNHLSQIGRENTPSAYVQSLVEIFREARRVLRPDGSLWLNIGDSYAKGPMPGGVKKKDILGIPWMLAFALRADGWHLRTEIIWHKPNGTPESVRDQGKGMVLPGGYRDPFMKLDPPISDSRPGNTANSRPGTRAHIAQVRRRMDNVIAGLAERALRHDQSKLESPEVEHFDRAAFRLAGCTYGSEEYRAGLADLKPALDHHYAVNSHHPEHHADGIRGMNLLDLVEMICDWDAATGRGPAGNIRRSIELNQARFGYSDELKQILLNTLPVLED